VIYIPKYEKEAKRPLKSAQQQENEQLRGELQKVEMERDTLKNCPRGCPSVSAVYGKLRT